MSLGFIDRMKVIFNTMKDVVIEKQDIQLDIDALHRIEYKRLLDDYNRKQNELNNVGHDSENVNAICCELQAINFRLKEIRKDLI